MQILVVLLKGFCLEGNCMFQLFYRQPLSELLQLSIAFSFPLWPNAGVKRRRPQPSKGIAVATEPKHKIMLADCDFSFQ